MSTTPSRKNHLLTLEQKKKLMLEDLELELQHYKQLAKKNPTAINLWWADTLERKVNEYHQAS